MAKGMEHILRNLKAVEMASKAATRTIKELEAELKTVTFSGSAGDSAPIDSMAASLEKMALSVNKLARARRSDAKDFKLQEIGTAARAAAAPIAAASKSMDLLNKSIVALSARKGTLGSLAAEISMMAAAVGQLNTSTALGGKVSQFLNEVALAANMQSSRPKRVIGKTVSGETIPPDSSSAWYSTVGGQPIIPRNVLPQQLAQYSGLSRAGIQLMYGAQGSLIPSSRYSTLGPMNLGNMWGGAGNIQNTMRYGMGMGAALSPATFMASQSTGTALALRGIYDPLGQPEKIKTPETDSIIKDLSKAEQAALNAKEQFVKLAHAGDLNAAEKELESLGISFKDLKTPITDATTGYTKFRFQTEGGRVHAPEYTKEGVRSDVKYLKEQAEIKKLADLQAKQAADQAEQAAKQANFSKAFGKGSEGAKKAAEYLKGYNFQLKDLSKVTEDAVSKTRIFEFRQKGLDGTMRTAQIGVNRYGEVVGKMSNQFKGFMDMLSQNIDKVLRWSIAVMAVYGAFSKLQQAMGNLVKWDEYMSDIELSTTATGEALDYFFDRANEAARATGTGLAEVLSIYDDALKTTRSITDETERFGTAGQLVKDSLIFSRLTGTGQSESLDIIVGSTRQFKQETNLLTGEQETLTETLGRSSKMLDVWVYLSQRGKLSVKDLAETFATVGATAESTGVSMTMLASMAAVMSENTTKSASETANSIKRLMTFLQGESGASTLRAYGIALNDLSGQARSFDDILTEIAVKVKTGAISGQALAKIGYSIGGGSRGMAEFTTLVKSWSDVMGRAADAEINAGGSAELALAVKSKTLQTAVTNLDTSFNNFIRTLGTDGGFIDTATDLISSLTAIADVFSILPETIGAATVRMAAFGLASSMAIKYGPVALGGIKTRLGVTPELSPEAMAEASKMDALARHEQLQRETGQLPRTFYSGRLGTEIGAPRVTPVDQAGWGSRAWSSVKTRARNVSPFEYGVAAMYGISATAQAEPDDKLIKGGAVVGGAIASTLLGAGPMIGAAIGDAASEAFIRGKTDLETILADPTKLTPEERLVQQSKISEKIQGGLLPTVVDAALLFHETLFRKTSGKSLAEALRPEDILMESLVKTSIEAGGGDAGQKAAFAQFEKVLQSRGGSTEDMGPITAFILGIKTDEDERDLVRRFFENYAAQKAAGETPQLYQKLLDEQELAADRRSGDIVDILQTQRGAEALGGFSSEALRKVLESEGKISMSQLKTYQGHLDQVKNVSSLSYLDFLGQTPEDTVNTLSLLEDEALNDILNQIGILHELDKRRTLSKGADIEAVVEFDIRSENLEKTLEYYRENASMTFEVEFEYKGFTDYTDYTLEEIKAGIPEAQAIALEYSLVAGVDVDDVLSMYDDAILAWAEEAGLEPGEALADSMLVGFGKMEGLGPFLSQVLAKNKAEAEKALSSNFNLERMADIEPEQFGDLKSKAGYFLNMLNKIPGYSDYAQPETFTLLLGENPTVRQIITTTDALRLATEDLTAVNKKQLEGMWNIPEGATVMVPLSSLYYAPKGGAGTGGEMFGDEYLSPTAGVATPTEAALTDAISAVAERKVVHGVVDVMDTTGLSGLSGNAYKPTADKVWDTMSMFMGAGPMSSAMLGTSPYGGGGSGGGVAGFGGEPGDLLAGDKGLLSSGLQDIGSGIRSMIDKMESLVQAVLAQPPITINTTVTLDGDVISKSTRTRIAEPLQNTARAYGYTNGSIIA